MMSKNVLLNPNLIAERNQSIDCGICRTAQENQIRAFLKNHDALSFLIHIKRVNLAHCSFFCAA